MLKLQSHFKVSDLTIVMSAGHRSPVWSVSKSITIRGTKRTFAQYAVKLLVLKVLAICMKGPIEETRGMNVEHAEKPS